MNENNENNKTSLSIKEWMRENGLKNFDEVMVFVEAYEDVVPALCTYGCEVEPDGTCPHGNPSILLELGLI